MSTASPQHSDPPFPRRDVRAALSTVRWRREVPNAIRSLGALADADYADIVTATTDEPLNGTPEQLVYAALDRPPRASLVFVAFVQRVFLGFRLKLRPSPDYLLGWKISDRSDNWMRIETTSWFMTAHVVMHYDEGQISLAAFIRYDRRLATLVWPPISLIHRQVALALVRSAIRAQ
ncbi:MAG TPA: hypothetical protein VIC05_10380 [Solirubrobacteraceae bacterium]|jgi:hypothetical protein